MPLLAPLQLLNRKDNKIKFKKTQNYKEDIHHCIFSQKMSSNFWSQAFLIMLRHQTHIGKLSIRHVNCFYLLFQDKKGSERPMSVFSSSPCLGEEAEFTAHWCCHDSYKIYISIKKKILRPKISTENHLLMIMQNVTYPGTTHMARWDLCGW